MSKITVLGGGITGITTGIVLELLGHETELYTEKRLDESSPGTAEPELATAWPAGAVYPVTVEKDNLRELFEISQNFFRLMWRFNVYGVRKQRFRSISEGEIDRPRFSDLVSGFDKLEDEELEPSRDIEVEGYGFDIFSADMKIYLKRLYDLYEELGGEINEERLEKEDFLGKDGMGVNCTGYWSREMFDDDSLMAVKGHLIHVDCQVPETENGEVLSFDYDLDEGGYSHVYCFPRMDTVIFGGSHLKGKPGIGEEWSGEEEKSTVEIEGVDIPERMIEINSKFLDQLTGDDLRENIEGAYEGYRPYREKGVRLEKQTVNGSTVIHNYGHGGAGVTLSWGCAVEVAQKIGVNDRETEENYVAESLQELCIESVRKLNS